MEVCFGWMGVGGHFLWVGGGGWAFFIDGWGEWRYVLSGWGWSLVLVKPNYLYEI